MGERIDLPSGGWIELRDPATFRRGDKKRIMRSLVADVSGTGSTAAAELAKLNPLAVGLDMTDALAVALIENWEIPYLPNAPVPVPVGLLDQLTLEDSESLDDALTPVVRLLFPAPVDHAQFADPSSPSAPASA